MIVKNALRNLIGMKAKDKVTGEMFEVLMFHFVTGEIWVDRTDRDKSNYWENANQYDLTL